jgi:hypothetical protein
MAIKVDNDGSALLAAYLKEIERHEDKAVKKLYADDPSNLVPIAIVASTGLSWKLDSYFACGGSLDQVTKIFEMYVKLESDPSLIENAKQRLQMCIRSKQEYYYNQTIWGRMSQLLNKLISPIFSDPIQRAEKALQQVKPPSELIIDFSQAAPEADPYNTSVQIVDRNNYLFGVSF